MDADEEYFIYYSPESDRKSHAVDCETEDYVRHGSDADYQQRMLSRVLNNHSPPPEFYDRVTDEELEQELQYDLHCEEDYVRRLSSGVTLGRPFPSDFAKTATTVVSSTAHTITGHPAQTTSTVERAKPQKVVAKTSRSARRSAKSRTTPESSRGSNGDVEVRTPAEQAAVEYNLRPASSDPNPVSATSIVHQISKLLTPISSYEEREARFENGRTLRPREQFLYPAVPYAPDLIVYDCCLDDTCATFDTLLENWFLRYNEWAATYKLEPIHLTDYYAHGIKPVGSWNTIELQLALDMLRDYETSYHRVIYRTSHYDQKRRELYKLRYYRRTLELRYFVSTYFTDFALSLAAREQISGLYNTDNLNELHFILNARITRQRVVRR